ncbi:hypothetical protein [Porphyrobacter sp. CACIAM 03H1]|uniref:hypothetical protein n=1 Tax=Porphyrobacter sp. CACIAM 03H1 TaxID=2003315 RepID=UPI0012FE46C4|nr:hypothetical protein [Porphyrobacter sp. CACIAM 03H1]
MEMRLTLTGSEEALEDIIDAMISQIHCLIHTRHSWDVFFSDFQGFLYDVPEANITVCFSGTISPKSAAQEFVELVQEMDDDLQGRVQVRTA